MSQFSVYKGTSGKFGALQFKLLPSTGEIDNVGVVFVEACSSTGPNQYDWANKIIFALSPVDTGKMLHFMVTAEANGSLSLVHDPNMKGENQGKVVKTMQFYTKEGVLGGMMITVSKKENEAVTSHKIPLSGDEVMVLKNLLEAAIPAMFAW